MTIPKNVSWNLKWQIDCNPLTPKLTRRTGLMLTKIGFATLKSFSIAFKRIFWSKLTFWMIPHKWIQTMCQGQYASAMNHPWLLLKTIVISLPDLEQRAPVVTTSLRHIQFWRGKGLQSWSQNVLQTVNVEKVNTTLGDGVTAIILQSLIEQHMLATMRQKLRSLLSTFCCLYSILFFVIDALIVIVSCWCLSMSRYNTYSTHYQI